MRQEERRGEQQSDGKDRKQVIKPMNYWKPPARTQARIRKPWVRTLGSVPANQQCQSYRHRDYGGSSGSKARDGFHLCGALTSFSTDEVNARESTGNRTGNRTHYGGAVSGRRLISRGGNGGR